MNNKTSIQGPDKITLSKKDDKDSMLEELSELEHDQWMKWAKDLMKKEQLTKERTDRWEKECFMPYADLTEEMKDFDREWARKAIKITEKYKK
jgi:hypothetical protein